MGKSSGNSFKMIDKFIELAKLAALNSGKVIEDILKSGQNLDISTKESSWSPVTKADLESERIILELLTKEFPNFNFLSEESSQLIDNGSKYCIVIDPLDGTKAAMRNHPLQSYCVSIGLLEDFIPVAGVVLRVGTKELFWGSINGKAYKNDQVLIVEENSEVDKSLVGTAFHNTPADRDMNIKIMDKLRSHFLDVPNELGATHSILRVAEGQWDGFVHRCRPWDFAAAIPILLAGGGKVTDWQGKTLNFQNDWLSGVFSNGLIHEKIIEVINS